MPYDPENAPCKDGFFGTIPQFLDWLKDELAYGGVRIDEPIQPDPTHPHGRTVIPVSLVTAGYSDDESLIGRVAQGSVFAQAFWESSHRGGLHVFHVREEDFHSEQPIQWLDEATDVFSSLYRARHLTLENERGEVIDMSLPAMGVQLSYQEADDASRFLDPHGVLRISPLPDLELD